MKSIAGYNVIKLLAKGGMAAIYLAEQESLQRQVVLKFLQPKLDESIRKRFIDEGRIIASLEHPNIITVFDVVSTDKYNFLTMEFLEGGDLEHQLQIGMDTYHALDIISKISDALHTVHKQGIVHGDIKPANVLFRRSGCPLLTDFGISHQSEPKKEIDKGSDDLYASPTYASPELIQGKPFDYRTDIYSLGIMIYEMLVGEKPYHGDSEMEIVANSIQEPIPKLPAALKEFQPLMEKLLAKNPDDRLSDAKLVTRFVDQYLKDHPDLKTQASETKLIDSDVIVEYVSKRKPKKANSPAIHIFSPLLLTLIIAIILWLNKDALWNQFFEEDVSIKPVPTINTNHQIINSKPLPVKEKTVKEVDETSLLLKQTEEDLLRQQELLNQKDEEIERVRQELLIEKEAEIERVRQELIKQKEKEKQLAKTQRYDRQRTIASLLRKGNQGLIDYRLTTPLNNNALYYFQKVLDMEAGNKKARQGITDVVYRYELLARGELDKYEYQKAQQYISTGLSIDSDNERLLELQKKANIQNEPERAIKKVKNFFKNL